MKIFLKKQMITKETVCFKGEFDHNGQLCTRVYRRNKSYLIKISPLKFIDSTLKKSGSSFRGANDGAKSLLGKKNMRPMVIDAHSGIYIFPSKSPLQPDCIWFSLLHIVNYEPFNRIDTKVYLSYGHSVVVDMKADSFQRKMSRALDLRQRVSENLEIPITFFIEPRYRTRSLINKI